jgi:hypothetical protein
MNYKSNPVHTRFLARFQNNGEERLLALSCPSVGLEYRLLCFRRFYEGPPRAGPSPGEKFFGPHNKSGPAKDIYAKSENLSVAELLGPGLKELICSIDR